MKNRTRKLIAFLLTLVMMVNIMPMSSFADDNAGEIVLSEPRKPVLVRTAGDGNGYTVDVQVESGVTNLQGYKICVVQKDAPVTQYNNVDAEFSRDLGSSSESFSIQKFYYWGSTEWPFDANLTTEVYLKGPDNSPIYNNGSVNGNPVTITAGQTSATIRIANGSAPDENDDVFITIQSDDSLSILGATYLVVGWNNGNDSYAAKSLNGSLVGDYSFNTKSLPTNHETLFVVLKHYNSAQEDPRGYDGTALIANNNITSNPHDEVING